METSQMNAKVGSQTLVDPYASAMEKLRQSAWRFSRERDSVEIQAFELKDIEKDRFREQLRRGLGCKLTVAELDSLMPTLDTSQNGMVDGIEFLLLFYRIKYEVRNKALTDRLCANRKIRTNAVEREKQRQLDVESLTKTVINFNFTEEESKSAFEKLAYAAEIHDRLMPGSSQLSAFEGEYVTPFILKDQLFRVLNVRLTPSELGAIIRFFNKNEEETNIKCSDFLVWFIKTGFEERSKHASEKRAERKKINDEKEQRLKHDPEAIKRQLALKVDQDFKEQDKISAINKLRTAARLYDKSMPGALNLNAFDIAYIPPYEFREQLRRLFNLKLNPAELGGIMEYLDCNADGMINCGEFVKSFLAMGIKERERESREIKEKQWRIEEKRKALKEAKEKDTFVANQQKVSYDFTEQEFQSAVEKLTEAAWKYDKTKCSSTGLEAFDAKLMLPHVFKEQLKRVFNISLSPPELGALMTYFDKDGDGNINCAEFLIQFFRTGFEERSRRNQIWRKYEEDRSIQRKNEMAKKELIADQRNSLKVQYDFRDEDFQSGIAKLTEAAIKYDKKSPGAVGLEAFEGESMLPHVFKEQLKRVFNINVTPLELGALMSYFDKDGNGYINCAEFLIQFFRTGFEERNRIRAHWIDYKRKKEKKDEEMRLKRIEDNQRRSLANVDYDFTEAQFDTALTKLVQTCRVFDRRQLGPGGLKAFEVDCLSPSEFREMLKRTFNLKGSAQELGALVTYFDTRVTGSVSCSTFLNTFAQIRIKVEEIKGKPGEDQLLQEYTNQLKAAYKARILQQQENGGSYRNQRPWQSNGGKSGTSTRKLSRKPYPKSAAQKLKRRITVAKQTGCLDLSSNSFKVDDTISSHLENSNSTPLLPVQLPLPLSQPITPSDGQVDHDNNDGEGGGGVDGGGDVTVFLTSTTQDSTEPEVVVDNENDVNINNINNNVNDIPPPDNNSNNNGSTPAPLETPQTTVTKLKTTSENPVTRDIQLSSTPDINFNLSTIPSEVFQIQGLRELWLCNNSIGAIPKQIGSLKYLQVLSLVNNGLEQLPEEIGELDGLKRLFLQRNQLTMLPQNISQLQSLTELNISYNRFKTISTLICSLSRLSILDASYNLIKNLPYPLHELRSLLLLNLDGNVFKEAPRVLGRMHWVFIIGCPIPEGALHASPFSISYDEEREMEGLLRGRAAARSKSINRRRKKILSVH